MPWHLFKFSPRVLFRKRYTIRTFDVNMFHDNYSISTMRNKINTSHPLHNTQNGNFLKTHHCTFTKTFFQVAQEHTTTKFRHSSVPQPNVRSVARRQYVLWKLRQAKNTIWKLTIKLWDLSAASVRLWWLQHFYMSQTTTQCQSTAQSTISLLLIWEGRLLWHISIFCIRPYSVWFVVTSQSTPTS